MFSALGGCSSCGQLPVLSFPAINQKIEDLVLRPVISFHFDYFVLFWLFPFSI